MLSQYDPTVKENLLKASSAINNAKQILLIAGERPDADLFGALVACYQYCLYLNKNVYCFSKEEVPENLQFLSFPNFNYTPEELNKKIDVAITFDIGEIQETGLSTWLNKHKPTLVNIDHHQSNVLFGDFNIVTSQAAATAELVYNLFRLNRVPINKIAATALLAGLMTDTANLGNPATSSTAMAMASDLIKTGGQLKIIMRHTFKNKTLSTLKLWGEIINGLYHNNKWSIATAVISYNQLQTNYADEELLEGLANFLTVLADTKAILVLKEFEPGKFKGSLRTTRDDVNVGMLAQCLGGGGHRKAAGFTLWDGQLDKNNHPWYIR